MALPCCPPFAQGGSGVRTVRWPDGHTALPRPASSVTLHPYCAPAPGKQPSKMMQSASQSPLHGCAMLSPLCTRGAAECLRWHTALPRWAIEPRPVVCWASLSPGKHNRPFPWHWARTASRPLPVLARQHRSTGANNAYSLQRVLGPAARWWISLFFPPFLWQISS